MPKARGAEAALRQRLVILALLDKALLAEQSRRTMPEKDVSSPRQEPTTPAESDPDRLRKLLVSSGLSPAEAARALSIDEKTLLCWCRPNSKLVPPRWALEMLTRLVAMKKKATL